MVSQIAKRVVWKNLKCIKKGIFLAEKLDRYFGMIRENIVDMQYLKNTAS